MRENIRFPVARIDAVCKLCFQRRTGKPVFIHAAEDSHIGSLQSCVIVFPGRLAGTASGRYRYPLSDLFHSHSHPFFVDLFRTPYLNKPVNLQSFLHVCHLNPYNTRHMMWDHPFFQSLYPHHPSNPALNILYIF